MVTLFDVEKPSRNGTRTADWADPEAAFAVVRSHVGLLAPRDALGEIRRYKAQLSAMETHALAAITKNDGERSARRAVDDGKTSKASARRAANRAKVAAKNPAVVDKMASGALSEDHLDVIADTAAKTDGAAAVDDAFIDRVGATTPDQAKAEAEKFVQNHNDPDGVQTEHDRQRAARRGVTYYNKTVSRPSKSKVTASQSTLCGRQSCSVQRACTNKTAAAMSQLQLAAAPVNNDCSMRLTNSSVAKAVTQPRPVPPSR